MASPEILALICDLCSPVSEELAFISIILSLGSALIPTSESFEEKTLAAFNEPKMEFLSIRVVIFTYKKFYKSVFSK